MAKNGIAPPLYSAGDSINLQLHLLARPTTNRVFCTYRCDDDDDDDESDSRKRPVSSSLPDLFADYSL